MSTSTPSGIWQRTMFHGSCQYLAELRPDQLVCQGHPLGPGLYMSQSFDVAARYARDPGGVHELVLPLVPTASDAVLNLDSTLGDQPSAVQSLTRTLLARQAHPDQSAPRGDAAFLPLYQSLASQNPDYLRALVGAGVWGCIGHMPATLSSGAMDRGLQIVSLRPETIRLGQFTPASHLFPSSQPQPY